MCLLLRCLPLLPTVFSLSLSLGNVALLLIRLFWALVREPVELTGYLLTTQVSASLGLSRSLGCCVPGIWLSSSSSVVSFLLLPFLLFRWGAIFPISFLRESLAWNWCFCSLFPFSRRARTIEPLSLAFHWVSVVQISCGAFDFPPPPPL